MSNYRLVLRKALDSRIPAAFTIAYHFADGNRAAWIALPANRGGNTHKLTVVASPELDRSTRVGKMVLTAHYADASEPVEIDIESIETVALPSRGLDDLEYRAILKLLEDEADLTRDLFKYYGEEVDKHYIPFRQPRPPRPRGRVFKTFRTASVFMM
jgi:hypothetical protein